MAKNAQIKKNKTQKNRYKTKNPIVINAFIPKLLTSKNETVNKDKESDTINAIILIILVSP